eukprot:3151459-Rhodomonas_salina.1
MQRPPSCADASAAGNTRSTPTGSRAQVCSSRKRSKLTAPQALAQQSNAMGIQVSGFPQPSGSSAELDSACDFMQPRLTPNPRRTRRGQAETRGRRG